MRSAQRRHDNTMTNDQHKISAVRGFSKSDFSFLRSVFSPGLNQQPPLRCTAIRNGGQHRY